MPALLFLVHWCNHYYSLQWNRGTSEWCECHGASEWYESHGASEWYESHGANGMTIHGASEWYDNSWSEWYARMFLPKVGDITVFLKIESMAMCSKIAFVCNQRNWSSTDHMKWTHTYKSTNGPTHPANCIVIVTVIGTDDGDEKGWMVVCWGHHSIFTVIFPDRSLSASPSLHAVVKNTVTSAVCWLKDWLNEVDPKPAQFSVQAT